MYGIYKGLKKRNRRITVRARNKSYRTDLLR